MAILPAVNGYESGKTPPKGTFLAICVDVIDEFGVSRQKFNSEETEVVDLTHFKFAFRDPKTGEIYRVTSRKMRISANPKASLFQFLSAWLGEPPRCGWDYSELKGQGAMITITHVPSKKYPGRMFWYISSVSPVPEELKEKLEALKKEMSATGNSQPKLAPVADPANKSGDQGPEEGPMPAEGW